MAAEQRSGMRIVDRAEFRTKPKPFTLPETATVAAAVKAMSERNYGSVLIVGDDERLSGIFTERDVMRKIVNDRRDPDKTTLAEVMTRELHVAHETDDVVDWLRIMSNERFRRLPIVDADGRPTALFTQGDFVSYTWPDLIYQARQFAKASVVRNTPVALVVGGIVAYSIILIILLRFL